MEGIYERPVRAQEEVSPETLLHWAQEISGEHAALLGAGKDNLENRGLFWAVLRHKLEIIRLPQKGAPVLLRTWPMPTTRSAYPRAWEGVSQDGQLLFRGISLWVLMSKESRAMVLPSKTGVTVPGLLRGDEIAEPKGMPQIQPEKEMLRGVLPEDLDENNHMNNCRYLRWAQELPAEALKEDCRWTVCYFAEAFLGDKLKLGGRQQEDFFQVEGCREEGQTVTRVFAARLEKL